MIRRRSIGLWVLSVLTMLGCATTKANIAKKDTEANDGGVIWNSGLTVQYLRGQMVTTSPDGSTPYGPPVSVLARRTIDSAGTVLEDSWHGTEHHNSFFKLRPGTLIFDVTNRKKTFEGTITFKTKNWVRGDLIYDIKMNDKSGTLTGTGTWAGETFTTNKLFTDAKGTPSAKVTETLKLITKEVFQGALPK